MEEIKPARRCPKCAKPIDLHLHFCREHWFELPKPLRDPLEAAAKANNFFAKARAMKAALDWFQEKRLYALPTQGDLLK